VPNRCVDCNTAPKVGDLASFSETFAETFAVRTPSGAALHLTLHLCLRCGSRFPTRPQLREYLHTRLPDYAVRWAVATARR